jgi:methionyl-tRNA formyltransferase
MKISILCTDPQHPVNAWLIKWIEKNRAHHEITMVRHSSELDGGDYLFLISCHEIIKKPVRGMYRHTLVAHASNLPYGRGMSPHIWQILEGKNTIDVTLLSAEDELDCGDIWHHVSLKFEGHELYDEINAAIFDAEIELMSWAIKHCDSSLPAPQKGEPTYYRKRNPSDSRMDVSRTLESQFELLRVADPERYPAFFDYRGKRYRIIISKMDNK